MHSSRPLPLPWSAPSALEDKRSPKTSRAGKAYGPPRPVPRSMTIAARSVSVRDVDKIFLLGLKSIMLENNLSHGGRMLITWKTANAFNELAAHSQINPHPEEARSAVSKGEARDQWLP